MATEPQPDDPTDATRSLGAPIPGGGPGGSMQVSHARVVERALLQGQLTAREAQTCLRALTIARAEGRGRSLRAVLEEAGIEDARIQDLDVYALVGRNVGGFELTAPIGVGGVGFVFLAEQVSLRRVVALKILDPQLARVPEIVERFQREARAAARLAHSHIVSPIDFGEDQGLHFFAMEFLEGGSVLHRIRNDGPFDEVEALRVIRQVAEALVYAEKEGVLHRDIKPDNILFDRHGDAKLADLGLVLDLKGADPQLTARGRVMGSPHYMAPEQARYQRAIDCRSDLYALGITLFEMLSGAPPFNGSSATEILAKHLTDPLPDLRLLVPELSADTVDLVERLVAKTPSQRPPAARVVVVTIDRIIGDRPLRREGPIARRLRRLTSGRVASPTARTEAGAPAGAASRRRRVLAVGLLAVALGAAVGAAFLFRHRDPTLNRQAEHDEAAALRALLLSKRSPDGGYGDSPSVPSDAWASAEAALGLVLLPGADRDRDLARLFDSFPGRALWTELPDGTRRFDGFPLSPRDDVSCAETTAAVGTALAFAFGRTPSAQPDLARQLHRYLVRTQNRDGSWASFPILGERGAMTGATEVSLIALVCLSRALRLERETYPHVARAARWLAATFDTEGRFFNVNPRRRTGDRRSIPGLNEETALALLEARALTETLDMAEDALVSDALRQFADAFQPSTLSPGYEGLTRPEDYAFPGLPVAVRATPFHDRWVAFTYRMLCAYAIARQPDLPRREAWRREALRLRAQLPGLAQRFADRPPWQVAEALLAAASIRRGAGDPVQDPGVPFFDRIRPR